MNCNGFIYLFQPEYLKGTNNFIVGKTKNSDYKKRKNEILFTFTTNLKLIEKKIRQNFDKYFLKKYRNGKVIYNGNIEKMKNHFIDIINNTPVPMEIE
tara:strand:- start:194 stop:487 length:294 start_codon:yes stop_codon:yes gene_type:complete